MEQRIETAKVVPLGRTTTATGKRFKIKNRTEILSDPEPAWLIDGIYPQDSLAEVFGNPDAYKSFLVLDAGCSVATGTPFLGTYEVRHVGDVVYVYGEGGRGVGKRLRAWELSHDCEAARFFGIAEPVDMLGGEPEALIADIKVATITPALIVLDTLARCFGGGDENSTKDMNAFVAGCDKLRRAFPGCTVLVVHHCGWEGTRGRGARAWEGALDTATKMESSAANFTTLSVTKQKDFAKPAKGIPLELVDVPGSGSAVLRLADDTKLKAVQDSLDDRMFKLICETGEKGMSAQEMEQRTSGNPNTLKTSRQRLKRAGRIEECKRRWYALPLAEVTPEIERDLKA